MDWPVLSLRLAGAIQLAILAANLPALRLLDVRRQVAVVASPFVRQVFWFHWAWVGLTVLAFAAMDLLFAEALAGGSPLGTFTSGVLAVLWGSRLAAQTLLYDRDLRRAHRAADLAFVVAFAYLAAVHAVAALQAVLA